MSRPTAPASPDRSVAWWGAGSSSMRAWRRMCVLVCVWWGGGVGLCGDHRAHHAHVRVREHARTLLRSSFSGKMSCISDLLPAAPASGGAATAAAAALPLPPPLLPPASSAAPAGSPPVGTSGCCLRSGVTTVLAFTGPLPPRCFGGACCPGLAAAAPGGAAALVLPGPGAAGSLSASLLISRTGFCGVCRQSSRG